MKELKNYPKKLFKLSFILFIFLPSLLLITNSGCSSYPEVIASWRDPQSTISFDSLHKILVIAAFNDEYNRKFTENRLADRLGNAGVRSYEYFSLSDLSQEKKSLIQKFQQNNFSGAVIVRAVSPEIKKEVIHEIPTFYLDYWTYYDYLTSYNLSRGKLIIETTFKLEVNVYSFTDNKLIWSCLTSDMDPGTDLEMLVRNAADIVANKMEEDKLVVKR